MQSVTEIPFNAFVGIETSADPAGLLRLPDGPKYLNHLGTVHASAQLALAEATSGEFLLRTFRSTRGIVPVVRRLEAKFHKPALGALTSRITTPTEALTEFDADLAVRHEKFDGTAS